MTDKKMAVEIKDLTVTFSRWGQDVTALDHLNLRIPEGQWVMLVGHNGSGKSTLLRTISGRLTPDAGTIALGGRLINGSRPSYIAAQLFHVHQDPLLGTAAKLTLFENLMVADHRAQLDKTPRRKLVAKYKDLLCPIGISGRLNQLVRYFSGGERQLIALVIAQLRPASIMLLDEALAALDPPKADLCLNLLRRLHGDGRTILQVTHDSSLAVSGGDRTVMLRNGQIVYDKDDAERHPAHLQDAWSS